MTQTVLITGGAGFIGSHLADAFIARGDRVLIIDDMSGGKRENLPEKAEFHEIDIRSPEAAEIVRTEGIELIVHQAGQTEVRKSVADPVNDASANIRGTINLLEAARESKVQQILFASTGGAIYGEQDHFPAEEGHPTRPVCPYGVSKRAVEHYLYYYHVAYGLNATCLRYANVYGERQNPHGEAGVVAIFLKLMLAGKTPRINGDGLQTRDYVYVGDVVRANLAAAGRTGFHVYNVGTGIETSVVEIFQGLRDALGLQVEANHGPGMPGEQRRSSIDSARLQAELGVAPPLSLEEGFAKTAAWFREQSEKEKAA